MIAYLKGTLEEKHPTSAIIDVAGIGYEMLIPLSTFEKLPAAGSQCKLLIYDCVREDSHQLFGFYTDQELTMFSMLLNTSGIGPKTALACLSGLSVRDIKAALVNGDVKRLNAISGVGKKLAERMIVELKDKISQSDALEAIAGTSSDIDMRMRDAILALVALGYKQETARKMVSDLVAGKDHSQWTAEDIVRKSLAV